jgi:hypothetical protein
VARNRGAGSGLAGLLFVSALGCSAASAPTSPGPATGGDRVLFVGNSLTYVNEVPLLVEALATAAGRPLHAESVTYGGFSLEDHWSRGSQSRIQGGGFRFVVLQQGPSALPDSRANLREYTRLFDAEIRKAGAETALYAVWPESFRRQAFGDVSESYRLAAADVGGIFLPVGDAWLAAWRLDASLALYGPDGFHPTPAGSYLAALTILGGLTGVSPVGLPRTLVLQGGNRIEIDARQAPLLQAAAEEALESRRE